MLPHLGFVIRHNIIQTKDLDPYPHLNGGQQIRHALEAVHSNCYIYSQIIEQLCLNFAESSRV